MQSERFRISRMTCWKISSRCEAGKLYFPLVGRCLCGVAAGGHMMESHKALNLEICPRNINTLYCSQRRMSGFCESVKHDGVP